MKLVPEILRPYTHWTRVAAPVLPLFLNTLPVSFPVFPIVPFPVTRFPRKVKKNTNFCRTFPQKEWWGRGLTPALQMTAKFFYTMLQNPGNLRENRQNNNYFIFFKCPLVFMPYLHYKFKFKFSFPGVGRNELKRRLLAMEPDRMKATVPHTSRL